MSIGTSSTSGVGSGGGRIEAKHGEVADSESDGGVGVLVGVGVGVGVVVAR